MAGTKMTLIVVPETKPDGTFWVDLFVAQHDADLDLKKSLSELQQTGETALAERKANPLACIDEAELEAKGIYKLEPLIQDLSDGRFMLGGLLFDSQIVFDRNRVSRCVDGTVKKIN